MIDELETLLPDDRFFLFISYGNDTRSDWKGFWSYAKAVQQKFNLGIKYPTKEERQEAWQRFNKLRDEASKRSEAERESIQSHSKEIRNNILSMCSGIKYSAAMDMVFFFDKTTVWQVKKWQEYLGEAMQELSRKKNEMLGEHKQQCYEKIQEIKESHDLFWKHHNEAWEARKRERDTKRLEYVNRIERNINNNKDRLRKAIQALERQKDRLSETRDKYYETTSEKWKGILPLPPCPCSSFGGSFKLSGGSEMILYISWRAFKYSINFSLGRNCPSIETAKV